MNSTSNVMTTSVATSRASVAVGADDDDEDDGLTLEEFLRECDKSPKSRVSHETLTFSSNVVQVVSMLQSCK